MFNILIIKLDAAGDVLRTTALLSGLDKIAPGPKHITWITKAKNIPILKFCPQINDIYSDDYIVPLRQKEFDFAVNFDEDISACDLLYTLKAKKKFGFINKQYQYSPATPDSDYAYRLSKDDELKFRLNTKTYPQIIYEMCGIEWSGERYAFNYPTKPGGYVALNSEVGDKWPTKKWLGWTYLKHELDVKDIPNQSQKKFEKLEEYFDWIAGSRIVVTGDSLGMHLAIAMGKPTIALFGPTSHVEIEPYDKLEKVYVKDLTCAPCYKKVCPYNLECMRGITVQDLIEKITKI